MASLPFNAQQDKRNSLPSSWHRQAGSSIVKAGRGPNTTSPPRAGMAGRARARQRTTLRAETLIPPALSPPSWCTSSSRPRGARRAWTCPPLPPALLSSMRSRRVRSQTRLLARAAWWGWRSLSAAAARSLFAFVKQLRHSRRALTRSRRAAQARPARPPPAAHLSRCSARRRRDARGGGVAGGRDAVRLTARPRCVAVHTLAACRARGAHPPAQAAR